MTLKELKELLETSQMPVAFNHFKTAQKLPYIVYIIADNNQFAADNVVYHSDPEIQVELYTERKDMASETTVESLISPLFFYTKEEGYLPDEQMYLVTYRFTL